MAEDFDVEAMLEAPYIKDIRENHLKWPINKSYTKDIKDERRHSPSSGHENGARDRYNGRRKNTHRSRSRSKGRSREREDITPGRLPGRLPARDYERERYHEYEEEKRRPKDRGEREKIHIRDRVDRRRSKSREKRERNRSPRERRRSRSKERRHRSRSKEVKRTRSKERPRGARSPAIERRRSKSRERKRSRSKERRRRSPSPRPFKRGRTPPNGLGNNSPPEDLTPEERDARTVFCMQLSQRIRARDLEEFFSSVGKVRDVRLITCNKTKRFKGIAYIEFKDPESVPLALGLSGQRLLGVPISVQHTQAEKNRMANVSPPAPPPKNPTGPMRLYIGSLHFNITEDMLRGIFEPFGMIDSIQLVMDPETGRSKGYGFITYHNAEDAKKALDQLNGFELAGRPMKVGNVTERLDMNTNASLDTDKMDRSGIDLGATGRLQLMFKLAEGAGLAVPQAAANALLATAPQPPPIPQTVTPPIATQCFMLSNMFDPSTETNPTWDNEIQDDVIDECNKHGGVLHVYVDTASPQGNVYVKCPSIATAVLAVNSLHGRWFAGRMITAAYVPLINYHSLFPDALSALILLQPSRSHN